MIFSKAKGQKRGFIFTQRTQSERGVFSTTLSGVAVITGILSIYKSYKMAGDISQNQGAVGLVSVIFAFVGLIFSIISLKEPDTFKLFPVIGFILSVVSLIIWGLVIYLGIG